MTVDGGQAMLVGMARHRAMWAINSACASKCAYCAIETQRRFEPLSDGEVARVARELCDLGFAEVLFGGGEPLMSPSLPAALDVLRGRAAVALFTGGVPGDARRWVDVIDQGVGRVVFSIDAGDDATNDRLRGRAGTTRDVLSLLRMLRAERPRVDVSINTVVTRINVDALEAVWDRTRELRPNSWSLTLGGANYDGFSPRGFFVDRHRVEQHYLRDVPRLAERLAADGAELVVLPMPLPFLEARVPPMRWGAEAERFRVDLDSDFDRYAIGEYNRAFVERYGCPLIGEEIVIGVGGDVYPCSQFPIIQPRYAVGNLRHAALRDVLAGPSLGAFRAGMPHEPCTRCLAPANVERGSLDRLLRRR